VALSPGSRLVFYSDGITEAVNEAEEEYGLDRLAGHVAGGDASAVSIVDDVRAFANGSGVRDDATVVFVGVKR
jgi:phosphoserine phosphatase RsbU/P